MCVFVCVFCLYPANHGWGVWCGCVRLGAGFGCAPPFLAGVLGCVCLCARSDFTPPFLAEVCGVGVSVRVLAFTCGLRCAPLFLAAAFWACVFVCGGTQERQRWGHKERCMGS